MLNDGMNHDCLIIFDMNNNEHCTFATTTDAHNKGVHSIFKIQMFLFAPL